MTLDPNAKKAAYDAALPALNRNAAPFHVIDLAIEAYLAASRPSAIVEEPICRLVPVEPTEAMLDAAHDAVWEFSPDYAPSDYHNHSLEGGAGDIARKVYRAMIAASPALNAALTVEPVAGEVTRAAVIEECAKIADNVLEGQPIEFGYHDGARFASREIAAAIRSLAKVAP